jgi:hypothetical protein
MNKVKLGRYRHYRHNDLYEVLGEVIASETLEEMVLYKQLHDNNPKYPKGTMYVRPKKMFLEDVEVDGQKVSRFKLVK